MIKQPKEGGTGLRDPVMAIDARRINILKKMITRDRQPWMRWIERKLKRVATRWKVSEAMAAKPKKREIKNLKETCLAEAALKIWFEIGGTKQHERIVEHKKGTEIKQKWESGYGVTNEDKWVPIEIITSKTTYAIIQEKRNRIKDYTPNPAHEIVLNIDSYLTPEERDYWWRLNHKLISTKKTESKFKRDEEGVLVEPICTLCRNEEETREHYNNKCTVTIEYRKK